MYSLPNIETWQWILLALAAFGIGISKTGIAGLSILSVALFAWILPGKASPGIVLPILICGDMIAVTLYRRKAVWSHVGKLFPWAAGGVIVGFFVVKHIDNAQAERLIGLILLGLIVLQVWRRRKTTNSDKDVPHTLWFIAGTGLVAGFTTMVANAAGPVMVLYLLASRLEKMEFVGTSAWFFCFLNLFKVPFSYELGLINGKSLGYDLLLGPCAIVGGVTGRWLIKFVDQKLFENLALVFTAAAAIRLLI